MGKENSPEITEIMSEDSKKESGERIETWDPSWSWPQGTKLTDRSRAAERLPAPLFACVLLRSCVRLFATPRIAARQASLSFTISHSLPPASRVLGERKSGPRMERAVSADGKV